ncbi:uncharacterized protein BJ171DRAFT_276622 [Polychytrium aggregatum]|uniref:uncharacterized protein n=1 Tax=Polychytrium aggregatum TaxID=110093 RepID=UPI0022FE1179|nr:uncharacterized protein BJ171DRAFT_276622 [Polychytrium aggregatum]KAI9207506.1 hypothetical protein BJ171DRAFT_276622 [Polychytrium aggregatum]
MDISAAASAGGQYALLGLTCVLHLFFLQVFLQSLGWPPRCDFTNFFFCILVVVASGSRGSFTLPAYVLMAMSRNNGTIISRTSYLLTNSALVECVQITPAVHIITIVWVSSQITIIDGEADSATTEAYRIMTKLSNSLIGLYGLLSVHFSHRSILLMKPMITYPAALDYVAYCLNIGLYVTFMAFVLDDDLAVWRTVAQTIGAATILVSWLVSCWIVLRTIHQLASEHPVPSNPPKKSSISKELAVKTLARANTALQLRQTRIAFYSLTAICGFTLVMIGAAATTKFLPNLSMIFLRTGNLFLTSYAIIAWFMLYRIIPMMVKQILPQFSGEEHLTPEPEDHKKAIIQTVNYSV